MLDGTKYNTSQEGRMVKVKQHERKSAPNDLHFVRVRPTCLTSVTSSSAQDGRRQSLQWERWSQP